MFGVEKQPPPPAVAEHAHTVLSCICVSHPQRHRTAPVLPARSSSSSSGHSVFNACRCAQDVDKSDMGSRCFWTIRGHTNLLINNPFNRKGAAAPKPGCCAPSTSAPRYCNSLLLQHDGSPSSQAACMKGLAALRHVKLHGRPNNPASNLTPPPRAGIKSIHQRKRANQGPSQPKKVLQTCTSMAGTRRATQPTCIIT